MGSEVAKVALIALEQCSASVLYGLYDVLSSVGRAWGELTGEDHVVEPFEVRIVARRKRSLRVANHIAVTPDESLQTAGDVDVVIVPDVHLTPDDDTRTMWPEVRAWLRQQYDAGAIVCSVCTGTAVLAGAGLLDGRAATTHWAIAEHIAASYPAIDLVPERVLVPTGDGDRIVTAGGAGAWEELALYLIGRFRDSAEAVRTSKLWVLGDRSEGQLPFAAAVRPRRHEDAVIAECQAWITENYEIASPVSKMVQRSGLADRTFKRRFRVATGYTPVEYVQVLRIEEAKHLLETGDLSTEDIGRDVGYEDPAFFRKLFKRRTGVTPARYRQRVRRIRDLG